MFYKGIISHKGFVQVTGVYERQDVLYCDLHKGFQLLKICEAPTKESLETLVKRALSNYTSLSGLSE